MAVGVTVIIAMTGDEVLLVAVKLLIFPEPLAAKPIVVLLFVHENNAPTVELVNEVPATVPLLHKLTLGEADTVGVGLTVMV